MTDLAPDKTRLPLPTRRWLTPDEAAAYLGIDRRQFDRCGFTPSRRCGKRAPRYDTKDLDAAMASDFGCNPSKGP